mmetsp:Transcript_13730/g.34457  ORF Transcript_13730/g.34457 Transcript_13730/m.34457 type:complete len:219 (-) Transcript_13730:57-713(-)
MIPQATLHPEIVELVGSSGSAGEAHDDGRQEFEGWRRARQEARVQGQDGATWALNKSFSNFPPDSAGFAWKLSILPAPGQIHQWHWRNTGDGQGNLLQSGRQVQARIGGESQDRKHQHLPSILPTSHSTRVKHAESEDLRNQDNSGQRTTKYGPLFANHQVSEDPSIRDAIEHQQAGGEEHAGAALVAVGRQDGVDLVFDFCLELVCARLLPPFHLLN